MQQKYLIRISVIDQMYLFFAFYYAKYAPICNSKKGCWRRKEKLVNLFLQAENRINEELNINSFLARM